MQPAPSSHLVNQRPPNSRSKNATSASVCIAWTDLGG
jgi:hypothetical protein